MFPDNRSFSVEDAVELVGEKRDEPLPQRIILHSKRPDVRWAQLEIDEDNFLHGMSVQFAVGHYPFPRRLPIGGVL